MERTFRLRESIGEIVGGLLLTALGVVWAVTSIGYGLIGDGGRLAPGTVPFGAGVILAVCGFAIAVKGTVAGLAPAGDREAENIGEAEAVQSAPASPAPVGPQSRVDRLRGKLQGHPVLSVYAMVTAGVLIMPVVGFSAAFALAIFSILWLVERQRVWLAMAIAVVTAVFGYVLFEVVFNLPLPEPFFF
jgi:hypothetical protein